MSMSIISNYLEDQRSAANLQTAGHADMESQCQKDSEKMGTSGIPPPTCHLGPQPGGCHPTTLILGTA